MPTIALSFPFVRTLTLCAAVALASGCASTAPEAPSATCQVLTHAPYDPAEPVNRGIFAFNRTVDDYLLSPVARGYRHLPGFFQSGVHNFVANFGEPKVFINDLLQGNGRRSATTLGRFAVNTTVGIVGLIDVSGRLGMQRHDADFGQTFGVWNIASGPIVELPLFGSANLRDATGRVLSFAVSPFGDNSDTLETLDTLDTVGGVVDGRAEALPLTDELRKQPDYYMALRDSVAERRAHLVLEGKRGAELELAEGCEREVSDE